MAVDEFAEGVSVGGVYQLIGNVWEWTLGDFDPGVGDVPVDEPDQGPLKNVRGGAYDTFSRIKRRASSSAAKCRWPASTTSAFDVCWELATWLWIRQRPAVRSRKRLWTNVR